MAAVEATEFQSGHINPYFFKHSSRSGNPEKASEWQAKLSETEAVEQ